MCCMLNHLQLSHAACEHKIPGKALGLSQNMTGELLKSEIILQQGETTSYPPLAPVSSGVRDIYVWKENLAMGWREK